MLQLSGDGDGVDHILVSRIPSYVRHQYDKRWCFAALPTPVSRWLERRFGWHLYMTVESQR